MKQTSSLTRNLASAQEAHAATRRTLASSVVVFRLYTESFPNLLALVSRYFANATLFCVTGLWNGQIEPSTVIEIVGTNADLQNVVHLAGDIAFVNGQQSVLVTWGDNRLDVCGLAWDGCDIEPASFSPDTRYQS